MHILHLVYTMTPQSKFIGHFYGYDVNYIDGCFLLDPLPELSVVQKIVSYLFSEGFLNDEEIF